MGSPMLGRLRARLLQVQEVSNAPMLLNPPFKTRSWYMPSTTWHGWQPFQPVLPYLTAMQPPSSCQCTLAIKPHLMLPHRMQMRL